MFMELAFLLHSSQLCVRKVLAITTLPNTHTHVSQDERGQGILQGGPWNALKKECEYNNANDEIVKEWLIMCKTESMRK